MDLKICIFILCLFYKALCFIPPKFQWTLLSYNWESGEAEQAALQSKVWIPENNMPMGIAKWRDKLFITVPRWKRGVPSSLNYISTVGSQSQPLNPYPSWSYAYVADTANSITGNSTVVSTFRVAVDKCDRLWVIDTGVADIYGLMNQITPPAILIFDLKTDKLIRRYELQDTDIKGPETFYTNIVVDIVNDQCKNAFAYISDMGASSLLVYSLKENSAWQVDHPYFHFDPHAGEYCVGGVEFYWSDGISATTLSAPDHDGYRDLYFYPLSSTRLFKISTKLLRSKTMDQENIFNGVQIVGNRGPKTQSNSCVFDQGLNVLFYTQVNHNGIACWHVAKPFDNNNTVTVFSDCNLMEFPSDLKIDKEGNIWMLSNKMARFLYSKLNSSEVNFRIMTAPASQLIQGTPCATIKKKSSISKALSFLKL